MKNTTHTYPDKGQCMDILKKYNVPANIMVHCQATANTALAIGKALNKNGYNLNEELLYSSAHLHDIKRTEDDHDIVGGELLDSLGYPDIGDIIRCHMYMPLDLSFKEKITEKEVVYLADKLMRENRLVTIEKRTEGPLKKFSYSPEIMTNILKRMEEVMQLKKHIEEVIGCPIESLLHPNKTFLIRHGEPDRSGQYENTDEMELSIRGMGQAQNAGEKLRTMKPNTKTVHSSNLQRALSTAEIIASSLDAKVVIHEDLMEFRKDEDYNYFVKRVIKIYQEIMAEADEDTIIVAHADVNKVLLEKEKGSEVSNTDVLQIYQSYCEITEIY